jgi:hypothetical protein
MGRGGARYGAGRPGWRRRCESLLSLDVRKLRRHGTLQPGTYAWGWSRDGEQYASVGIVVQPESLRLEYTRTPSGGESVAFQCTVRLERMPCRFGGERTYFTCPDCGRRCERLFGLDRAGRFACRLCLRLGYASESESHEDRAWRRQRKLEAQLEGDPSLQSRVSARWRFGRSRPGRARAPIPDGAALVSRRGTRSADAPLVHC